MAEQFVSAYAALKSDYVSMNGTVPIYLRLLIGEKPKNYPLKKKVLPEHWDSVERKVVKDAPNEKHLNEYIRQKVSRAEAIIYRLQNDDKQITFQSFENEYYKTAAPSDFFTYAEEQLKLWKTRLSEDTYKQYETETGKLKKFRSSFMVNDVDTTFLKRYEAYMRGTLKNKQNTVAKSMKVLRTFVIAAHKDDLILKNPFQKYSVKWEEGDRTFLTIEEVDSLEEYLLKCTSTKIKNVVRYFLFCCYTGLRYGGVKELEYKHIRNDVVYMHGAEIPLTDRAKALIDSERRTGKVFNVLSNSKSNDYVKLAFEACSIHREDQTLSFHSSRHTFGTISLNLGVSMDMVQDMYGHQSAKTTKIYAKLLTETKKNAMNVWNKPKNQ